MTTDLEDLLHGYLKMKTSFRGSILTEKVTTSYFKRDLYLQACKYKLVNTRLWNVHWIDPSSLTFMDRLHHSWYLSHSTDPKKVRNRDKKVSETKKIGTKKFRRKKFFISEQMVFILWTTSFERQRRPLDTFEMIDGGGIQTRTLVQQPKLKKLGRPESQENCTWWLFWGSEQP